MRRFFSIAAVILCAGGILSARSGMQSPRPSQPQPVSARPSGEKTVPAERKQVNTKADLVGPVAPGDTAMFMVGNFAAQHNGTVITCDSAVRYSDLHIKFFGNVLINKNTTYIYGDRAEYDGELNEARIYSDLVKVVDGDATLYTYTFVFNTLDNIGQFGQGGVLVNRDNEIESVRGYYYADTKELIAVDQVEMRNDEYALKGDSVVYNIATDNAHFFEKTNIWNKDGDYLYADRGEYHKADSLYLVTRNGYVLTEKQEMWSDSIDFYRLRNHIILRHDIQIDDAEHKVLAFGNFGEYWKEPGNAFLSRNPAVVSYDLSQGADSLFMRADSIYLNTYSTAEAPAKSDADSLKKPAAAERPVSPGDIRPEDGRRPQERRPGGVPNPETTDAPSQADEPVDSLAHRSPADSAVVDSLARAADTVQLTAAERKAQLREAAQKAEAEKKMAAAKAKKEKLDKIAAERKAKNNAKLEAQKAKEEARLLASQLKAQSKLQARLARAARKGKRIPADSVALLRLDSLLGRMVTGPDSLSEDLFAPDSLSVRDSLDSLVADSIPTDSIYRLIRAFRNVKIFRTDFQSVCDSLTAISRDSTIHLYIKPVLWNDNNQITSDVMDIFTRNQQLVRAEFVGSPMMVAEIDTTHYNQIAGKEMVAYFSNNQIYRNDVNGNAQTLYYMQDGEPPVVTNFFVIESGGISFYIEDKQIVRMVWKTSPVYNIYSIDQIPEDQSRSLKGFEWQGARRPTQQEVFDRAIRPSEREARSRLSRPQFPIRQRIDDYRKRLIEQRRWFDRVEQVDQPTVEWMHSLGFEVGQPRQER